MNRTPVSEQCHATYNEWMNKQWHTAVENRPTYFVMSNQDLSDLRRENSPWSAWAHSERKYTFMSIEIAVRTSERNGVELF